jgi:tripartite-type tricarboxylate transporter receptor subunit TctC
MLKRAFIYLSFFLTIIASPSIAQTNDFYKGKTLEIIAGFSPGGGYDAYARALGSVISKYIPGNPSIIVRNLTGAGSLRLALYLADAAPQDGTTIGIFDNGLMIAPLLKPDVVKLDASKLSWIGSVAKDTQVCMIWSDLDIHSINDLKSHEVTIGVTGIDDIRYMSTAMMRSVAGAKVKIVPGYPGSTDIRLAIERRELDGVCDSWQSVKSTKEDWILNKKVTFLVQMVVKSHIDLPRVPKIIDFADDTIKNAVSLLVSSGEAGRSFVGPPHIPKERVDILRQAFNLSMKDKDFIDLTNKAHLDVEPMQGEEIEKLLLRVYNMSPNDIRTAQKLIE